MAGCGIVPLNLLLTLESIPFCLRHEERPMRQNCWCWWRSKDLVRFFTILVLLIGVILVILPRKCPFIGCFFIYLSVQGRFFVWSKEMDRVGRAGLIRKFIMNEGVKYGHMVCVDSANR